MDFAWFKALSELYEKARETIKKENFQRRAMRVIYLLCAFLMFLVACVPSLEKGKSEMSVPTGPSTTPEGTMQSFILSLESGDLNRTLSHYVWGGHRNQMEGFFQRYGEQGMRDFASYYRTAKLVRQEGDYAYFEYEYTIGNETSRTEMQMVKTREGVWAILQSG